MCSADKTRRVRLRTAIVVACMLVPATARAGTEWQVRPFIGLTFGGSTTLVDLEHAAGKANAAVGISGSLMGDVFGVEFDVAHAPGFFESGGKHFVSNS